MDPWTARAFGPWYLRLYAHRDDAEAGDAVRTLSPWLLPAGLFLDAACGGGRHLAALRASGRRAVGIDRSETLLRAARAAGAGVVRADMRRLPFPAEAFSGVLSMFTSFGYFEDRAAHRRLLDEFRRVSVPGGVLVLDYLNAAQVRGALRARSERRVETCDVEERREIRAGRDGDRVVKEITIRNARGEVVERYHEEVALYEAEVVVELLLDSGWEEIARYGDYKGAPWTPVSPRLLLVARSGAGR